MNFYSLKDAPLTREDKVFKAPTTATLIWLIVFLVVLAGCVVLAFDQAHLHYRFPRAVIYIVGAFCVACALLAFGTVRARLKPTNWILRCNPSGIFLKYRSCENWRMPADDVQIVGFDFGEIAWARESEENRLVGLSGDPDKTQIVSCIDFRLLNGDTAELEEKLAAERNRPWVYRTLSYPVNVLPDGIIRVQWKGFGADFAGPSDALHYLSQYFKIIEPLKITTDLRVKANSTPEEAEAKIAALIRSGDKIAAIKLTREVYDCSLADAVDYVDKIK